MSWLFSRALVEAFSPGKCSDGERYAPLSLMPTPQPFLRNGKTTAFLNRSLFGLTCELLTDHRGAALLTSFLEAFRAKTSVLQGGGQGIDGERSGLWRDMARIIREVRPRFAWVENSPMLTSRGLGVVLGDLAEMGFDAEWGVLGAADVGAPHQRDRLWILAYSNAHRSRKPQPQGRQQDERGRPCDVCAQIPNTHGNDVQRLVTRAQPSGHGRSAGLHGRTRSEQGWTWWSTEPGLGRVVDGVAHRMDRLKCLGNGQVPHCAAEAWRRLIGR